MNLKSKLSLIKNNGESIKYLHIYIDMRIIYSFSEKERLINFTIAKIIILGH
jgi:hypothetical protein